MTDFFKFFFFYGLSRLLLNTVISGMVALLVGSGVGTLVGAMRRRMADTLYITILGAFLGCLVACLIPTVSIPGALQSWGAAGGLGSLSVLVVLFFIVLGGLAGSIMASTFGFKLMTKLSFKVLAWMLVGIYILMTISLYQGYVFYCFPGSEYC
jgi:hypothetical protein